MTRHSWDELPEETVAEIVRRTGSITAAEPATSGFSSQLAMSISAAGGKVFVKGIRADHRRVWQQHREAAVNPHVTPIGARLLWRTTAGGWDLLGFEHLPGREADYAVGSPDLPLIADAMAELGRRRFTGTQLADAVERWGSLLDDPAQAVLFEGDALVHSDWNPTNVLIDGAAARVVDWSWATHGPAWIDPACWIVWLIVAGHTPRQAEQWASRVPSWPAADDEALDLFAVAQARDWDRTHDAHPNAWTRELRAAAHAWAALRQDARRHGRTVTGRNLY